MVRIYCKMFKCSIKSIVGYFTGGTAFDYRTHATIWTSPVVRLGNCVLDPFNNWKHHNIQCVWQMEWINHCLTACTQRNVNIQHNLGISTSVEVPADSLPVGVV
jgi:hypothetical protein